ncbi:MAG: transcription termination factor NusA [Candidatus Dormibacteraeota bacterium]|nr:transcription termination factor NusA [Candidatus Dormibacteraeota bacterium]
MVEESSLTALERLSTEVGVPLEDLQRTVEAALAAAYTRAFAPPGEVVAHLVPVTGELKVSLIHVAPDGSTSETDLPVDQFKRLAAQTARTAVMRHLRDLERERALTEVARHRDELRSGIVDRIERGAVFIDLGKVEGWMPPEEQIPGEELRPGRPVTVVVQDPQNRPRQAQVRVSRASRTFVLRLLEAEVPEIEAGSVQVRAIVREPGLRTKIAVASMEPGIDPVGACVGPRGVRHRSLLAELGQEHVDIVPWDADPERFVAAALGPARVTAVDIDHDHRTAHVTVPRDQLSLAIGRDGQNARLAAKLTGWRVDIKGDSQSE